MSNRNGSVLDALVKMPWWGLVILAFVIHPILKLSVITSLVANAVFIILLLVAAMSAFNAWRRGELLAGQTSIEDLRKISWREFEELVGEAYRRKGYTVLETGGGGADGGIDLILRKEGRKTLVQCKHWKTERVGVKIIRELYGVIAAERAAGGIVVTSGSFTQEARDFAKGKPLELITGLGLRKLISEVQSNRPREALEPAIKVCPLCGAEMVLRTAQKGAHAGEKFWGCSGFPKCRSTMPFLAKTDGTL